MNSLSVLYEDNHLLVIDKPAGLPTMGVAAGEPSAVVAAKDYLRRRYNKPGNVYVGVVSRLDAPVSGVLLLARTSKAAARLTEQFKAGTVEKTYVALVENALQSASAEWTDQLIKDDSAARMRVVPSKRPDSQLAALRYTILQREKHMALVDIQLVTGRKHQIRVQFGARGHPVVGDKKYGSVRSFARGIALHARRLVIEHPVRQRPMEFQAGLPSYWPAWTRTA